MRRIIVSLAVVSTLVLSIVPVGSVGDHLPGIQSDPYLGDLD